MNNKILRFANILLWCLLLSLFSSAHAQDPADDPPAMPEQDAQDVLGDRAQPPDLSNSEPPEGVVQGENAGSANISIPAENTTETHTESHESSSSFSMGSGEANQDNRPVAGEIRNNPPPPPGWPGSKHANRPNNNYAGGPVTTLKAGPIWNNDDARGKCPRVCDKNQMGWTGGWRTVGFNKSVCDCAPGANASADQTVSGPGTWCEAPANYQCPGCSVHCPGDRIAHCTSGDRGIFTDDNSAICSTAAKCECR